MCAFGMLTVCETLSLLCGRLLKGAEGHRHPQLSVFHTASWGRT